MCFRRKSYEELRSYEPDTRLLILFFDSPYLQCMYFKLSEPWGGGGGGVCLILECHPLSGHFQVELFLLNAFIPQNANYNNNTIDTNYNQIFSSPIISG